MRFVHNPFTDKLDVAELRTYIGGVEGNDGIIVGPDSDGEISLLGNNSQGINVTGDAVTNTLTIAGIDATDTQKGILETSTNAEAAAQSSSTVALTPSNITSMFSTTPLPASQGGTGVSSPAANSLLVTNGSSAFSVLGVAGNGQIPIGSIGSSPVLANIASADSSVTITNGPGTIDLSVAAAFTITPYIVGPVGLAPYQTIQSALDAAGTTGTAQLVFVMPGTYTEDLTFPNVNIAVWGDRGGDCIIVGQHTPSATANLELHGLLLQSATNILNSADAGSGSIEISDTFIIITNGYVFNLINWVGELLLDDCGEASTNDGVVNNTGGATIKFLNTEMGAGSGQVMTLTGNGNVRFDTCNVNCPVSVSGSGALIMQNGCKFANTVTIGGSKSGTIVSTDFLTGTNQAIIYNSSGDTYLSGITINSSNNPSIGGTGSGSLTLSGVSFVDDSNVAGTVTISNVGLVDVGSIRSNFTNHGILLGQGTRGTITALAAATDGQLPIGSTGTDPVLATLSAGDGISIANGAGSISISSSGGGHAWTDVTGTTQTITASNGYLSNNVGTVTFTLPASATIGDVFRIVGVQGSWTVAQNASQQILFGSSATTSGVGGSLSSTDAGDCIECVATNTSSSTVWRAMSSIGNITVV